MGRENRAGPAGDAGQARCPDTHPRRCLRARLRAGPPRTGWSAGTPRAQSPSQGAAGCPGRGAPLPPGSASYTTAPAGGSPAGPQARAYATAALLTQFHRGLKSRDPSLGLPSGAVPTPAPGPGPGSQRRAGARLRHTPGTPGYFRQSPGLGRTRGAGEAASEPRPVESYLPRRGEALT